MNKFDRKELEKEMLFDPMNRWYVGRLNLLNLVKPPGMPNKVIIKDETLREGEDTPMDIFGVALFTIFPQIVLFLPNTM
jgi:hypothetical protein